MECSARDSSGGHQAGESSLPRQDGSSVQSSTGPQTTENQALQCISVPETTQDPLTQDTALEKAATCCSEMTARVNELLCVYMCWCVLFVSSLRVNAFMNFMNQLFGLENYDHSDGSGWAES